MPESKASKEDPKEVISHVEDASKRELSSDEAVIDELADGEKLLELKKIIGDNREEQEKKLVRKMDLRLLPMLMVIYILNYLDRTNIATARLGGLEKDTGLKGTQYNTVISIFFVGYVVMQMFTNLLLNRVRPSILLPGVMIAWATVSACGGAVQSYGGWIAVRFLLGFVESPYFAGSIFMMSSWYTEKELTSRISVMYTASQLSGAFGGLIGQAILNRFDHDNRGIEGWRWLFIIEATITVPFAILAMFVLPDFPYNTRFLSEKERALAQLRMLEDASREDNYEDQSIKSAVKDCFTDVALYPLWILQLSIVTAAGVNAYFPTIVGTLGYGRTKTLLLTVPPWIVSALWSLTVSFHSDYRQERFWHIMLSVAIALVGFIISIATMNIGARYFSMFLMLMIYGGFTTTLSWVSSSLSRPPAKRAIAIAFINAFSNVSSTYSSYFYPASSSPKYLEGMACNIAFCALGLISCVVSKFYLEWRNKKLDEANEQDLASEGKRAGTKSTALSERWGCDPHFRFLI